MMGRLAGSGSWQGRPRKAACKCQATSVTAASTAPRTASRVGRGYEVDSAARIRPAMSATASEIPRWKWPASEWGQGSMARTTSLPSSESVHSALAGQ